MPRHFQRAARAEFYGQRTVFVLNRFLIGVKNEVFRFWRSFHAEFPFRQSVCDADLRIEGFVLYVFETHPDD